MYNIYIYIYYTCNTYTGLGTCVLVMSLSISLDISLYTHVYKYMYTYNEPCYVHTRYVCYVFVENDYVKIEAPLPTTGESIEIDSYICTTSEVGNPHLMVEVEDVEKFDLDKFSINARNLDVFSNGVNIEIFSVVERKFIYARVNERGVGETDACGSGALALFTYLREINKVDDDAVVLYPGGELELSYEKEKLYLKGEVTYL